MDKVDLAAIVIHKCVPTHEIHFIWRICPQNPAPGATAQGLPSQAVHRNLATGPKLTCLLSEV